VGEHVKACDFAVVGGATVFLPLSGCLLVVGAHSLARQPDLAAGRRGGRRFQNQGSRRPTKASAAGRRPPCMKPRSLCATHEYSTDILHFGKTLGSGDRFDANVGKLRDPVDKPVSLFSAPDNHDLAMLEPGVKGEASWLLGAGAAFFCSGSPSLVGALRR
jgi:hypothetical protein